jgi:hypothetical protein
MRFSKRRSESPPPQPQRTTKPGPPWQEFLDPMERPNREARAEGHSPFESMLEPVPMPRWLRGRRRAPRDKMS